MEFCPKCGSILIDKRKNSGCARCGYSTKGKIKIKASEKINDKDKKKEVAVSKGNTEVFPIISVKCKKCPNEEAYFWTVQTRSGDEAETKFFKCTKCGHTWRDYR
jgi:DNA-directed RNA polymerase subunit M